MVLLWASVLASAPSVLRAVPALLDRSRLRGWDTVGLLLLLPMTGRRSDLHRRLVDDALSGGRRRHPRGLEDALVFGRGGGGGSAGHLRLYGGLRGLHNAFGGQRRHRRLRELVLGLRRPLGRGLGRRLARDRRGFDQDLRNAVLDLFFVVDEHFVGNVVELAFFVVRLGLPGSGRTVVLRGRVPLGVRHARGLQGLRLLLLLLLDRSFVTP